MTERIRRCGYPNLSIRGIAVGREYEPTAGVYWGAIFLSRGLFPADSFGIAGNSRSYEA
jgi:hypothetical protein